MISLAVSLPGLQAAPASLRAVFLDIACQNGRNELVLCRARTTQLTSISCVFLSLFVADEGLELLGFSALRFLGVLPVQ